MATRYDDEALVQLAMAVAAEMRVHGRSLATAESCTGGWIAKVCTDLPGSSEWFERGFVVYSNAAKQAMLGVSAGTLGRFGAVSEQVVADMARGALIHSEADFSVAVSGIAGPGGGTPDKPAGTVCFGWAGPDENLVTTTVLFAGEREAVRRRSVAQALEGLLEHALPRR